MEKTYNISRLEYNKNHDNEIVSIFLAVNVSDGENGTCFEHWLNAEEQALVLADEANLKPILEKCYAEVEIKLENEIATRPMPSIYPLQEEGKKETLETLVKVADIAVAKTAIVEEKIRVEEARLQAIEDAKPKPIEEPLEEPILDETK